ncbi:MAG: hypothetical protein U0P48_00470 [Ancrocorticia sp.]
MSGEVRLGSSEPNVHSVESLNEAKSIFGSGRSRFATADEFSADLGVLEEESK